MAVDPVEYIDGGQQYFQRYTYADNNPYKYTDPTGKFFVSGYTGNLKADASAYQNAVENAKVVTERQRKDLPGQLSSLAGVTPGGTAAAVALGLVSSMVTEGEDTSTITGAAVSAVAETVATDTVTQSGKVPLTGWRSIAIHAFQAFAGFVAADVEEDRKKKLESNQDVTEKDKSNNDNNNDLEKANEQSDDGKKQ
jgi:hypothetical protein